MSEPLADLHFHSQFSDGKYPVEWIAEELGRARELGCELAVLTDHDGIQGALKMRSLLPSGMASVLASEISCELVWKGRSTEVHLLVYGIQEEDVYFQKIFKSLKESRRQRFRLMLERLTAAGFDLDISEKDFGSETNLGRPHIAEALVNAGYAKDMSEAFDRFLKTGSPYLVKKSRPSLEEVLAHCLEVGAVSVLAHPAIYSLGREHLEWAAERGLSGLEVIHPSHGKPEQKKYRSLAESLGLKRSGGSDFHGYPEDFDPESRQPSLGRAPFPLKEAEDLLRPLLF